MIVFVGPQAVGKTTQAKVLVLKLKSQGYDKVHITRLITYALFQFVFKIMLRTLCKSRKVFRKFYEDEKPVPTVDPQIYRRLIIITEVLHLLGFMISLLKQKILMLHNCILIEHEGYVFKQLADLRFLAKELHITEQKSFALKLLNKVTMFLLSSALKNGFFAIILLRADYECIQSRCLARKSNIEPAKYIEFQDSFYSKIPTMIPKCAGNRVKIANINAHRTVNNVHLEILSYVMQYAT